MTDDIKKVKVSYKEYPSGLYGHDFDLTTIQDDGRQKFEDFLQRHGLSEYQKIETEHDKPLEDGTETHYQYVWHNPDKQSSWPRATTRSRESTGKKEPEKMKSVTPAI